MIKDQIILAIKKVLKEMGIEGVEPQVEHPADPAHGDYSSNIALAIFSSSKFKVQSSKFGSPLELAEEIAKKLEASSQRPEAIDRVEAVSPGFINFWLSKEYLLKKQQEIRDKQQEYGKGMSLKNKKIMVEFTDPNPFKEFHIGHLFSNIVGECLSRLVESQGAVVRRACYQGDVGLHVAKALYGLSLVIPNLFRDPTKILKQVQEDTLARRIKLLAEAYAMGARAYEEDESAKQEIESINRKVYKKDSSILDIWTKGRQWSLDYFEKIYQRLGTKFDFYYFESEAGEKGIEYVREHIGTVFEEDKGAVIFRGEKYGLHTRVFITSQGLPTYEAKELGLAPTKHKDFSYDLSVIVTGSEINEYFAVLLKALSLINPALAAGTKHVSHGMVRLPTGKMSSRTGEVLTGEWLLDETKAKIVSQYQDMDRETQEKVAVAAVKYALLKNSVGRDIIFSFEESISLEGNSGPYLQYTYARTQSVLAKVYPHGHPELVSGSKTASEEMPKQVRHDKLNNEEDNLLRSLHRFPEVVEDAAESFSPNILCNYLFDLAQKFNLFYQKHKIIGSESEDFRIALTASVGQVLKNGLYLLGISAPERM